MIQKSLYTSYVNFHLNDHVFYDDPFCSDYDVASIKFDKYLNKSVNLVNDTHHPS